MTDKKDKTLRPYQQAAIDALRSPGVADAAKVVWMHNTGPLVMLRDWLIGAEAEQIKGAVSGNPPRIEYKGGSEVAEAARAARISRHRLEAADSAWFLFDVDGVMPGWLESAQPVDLVREARRGGYLANKAADAYLSRAAVVAPRHPDVADAAWFLLDRTTYGGTGEFAERILRDTSSAGIINDARRHGFNPESDRRQYSGRVVPWELIDAAKGVITAQFGTLADEHAAIERLRSALKDL